jgi:hypothetical protein
VRGIRGFRSVTAGGTAQVRGIRGFRVWTAGGTAQVRGIRGFRVWTAGGTAQVRGIRGFRVWTAGGTAQVHSGNPKFALRSGETDPRVCIRETPCLPCVREKPAQVRGIRGFQVSTVGETGPSAGNSGFPSLDRGRNPPSAGNSGFPSLDRGRNRPSARNSWFAFGKPQVCLAFGRNRPKGLHPRNPKFALRSGETGPSAGNSGFPSLDHGRNRPKCEEFRVSGSRPWEKPPKWGGFGVSQPRPWEKPAQVRGILGFRVSTVGETTQVRGIRGFRVSTSGETAQVRGIRGFRVSTSGETAQVRGIRGFRVSTSGETAQVPGIPGFRVSTSGETAQVPGILGFRVSTSGETAQVRGILGFRVTTSRETAQVRGILGFRVSTSRETAQVRGIRGSRVSTSGETAQVWGFRGSRERRNRRVWGFRGFRVSTNGETARIRVLHSGRGWKPAPSVSVGKLGVFRADRERIRRPSVWGNSSFPGRPRADSPPKREGKFEVSGPVESETAQVQGIEGFHVRPGDGRCPCASVGNLGFPRPAGRRKPPGLRSVGNWGFPSVRPECQRGKLGVSGPTKGVSAAQVCGGIRGFRAGRERSRPSAGNRGPVGRRTLPMCECGKLGVSTPGRAMEAARIAKCGEIGVSIRPSKKRAIVGNFRLPCPRPSARAGNLGGFHGRPGSESRPSASARNLGSPCPAAAGSAQKCKHGKLGVSMPDHREKSSKCRKHWVSMSDGEGNRLGVVGSTEFPCTTAMENLCSCDEIRGFRA